MSGSCRFFAQGACRSGDKCRFSHELSAAMPPLGAPASWTPATAMAGMSVGAPDTRPPCSFFARGACRNGDGCLFSHAAAGPPSPQKAPAHPRIALPEGAPLFSIDVECVATAREHNARSTAQIALVDGAGRAVLDLYVQPEVAVKSYLTPLTGLTAELLAEKGTPLAEAMATLRAALPKNAVIVGQNVLKDMQWLGLVEGVDYGSLIDNAALFRSFNARYRSYSTWAQDHAATCLLGAGAANDGVAHNAVTDAQKAVQLLRHYLALQHDDAAVGLMHSALLAHPVAPSFAKLHPEFEGCCNGSRKTCTCGAPMLG